MDQIANPLVYYVLASWICVLVDTVNVILRTPSVNIARETVPHEADINLIQSLLLLNRCILICYVWIVLSLPRRIQILILAENWRGLAIGLIIRLLLDYQRLSEVRLLQVVAIAYKATSLIVEGEASLGNLMLLIFST